MTHPQRPQTVQRRKTSVGLAPALWKQVKIASAVSGREMYDIVARALERELTRKEYQPPQTLTQEKTR